MCTTAICIYTLYTTHREKEAGLKRVYFIANGRLLEAVAINGNEVLSIQLKKHIEMFHLYFYSLEPDDDYVKKNITKALYLADYTAKQEYDNLAESGYYTQIVSGNISQRIDVDSIAVNTDREPYTFTYYGKLKIIRPTSIVIRSLISKGQLRTTKISDNNVQGFIIERWGVIENKDLKIENR
jgi:conjugative transposon TraK protein